jgi:hypothetical protein
MPRPKKITALDQQLLAISQRMTAEVARVVGEEIARVVNQAVARNGSSTVAAGPRRGGPRKIYTDALVAEVLAAIKRSPGLRTEQLYKKMSKNPQLVRGALAKLREQKKVRTKGTRRAMTYTAA